MTLDEELAIARKYAPVLCHEIAKADDSRIFDCFTAIDFDGVDPWAEEDRRVNFETAFHAGALVPAVYYSLVSTPTHYFILYSVYHAFDQKELAGHEHDMEHVQVVVFRNAVKTPVELVATNAHLAYHYYTPYEGNQALTALSLAFRGDDNDDGPAIFHDDTHPVVYVQPGDGSVLQLLRQEVGHGIAGLADADPDRWDSDAATYDFHNRTDAGTPLGIVATVSDGGAVDPYPADIFDQGIASVSYGLRRVRDTIDPWFKRRYRGLFANDDEWEPEDSKLYRRSASREDYFKEALGVDEVKIPHPGGFVGSPDSHKNGKRRKAAGKWPHQWRARPQLRRWYRALHGPRAGIATRPGPNQYKELDSFFDPALAYHVLATPPHGRRIEMAYDHHPFLGIG